MPIYNLTELQEATSISAMSLAINDLSNGILFLGLLISVFLMLVLSMKATGFPFYMALFGSSGVSLILSVILIYFGGVGYTAFALFFVIWIATSTYLVINRE